MSGDFPGGPVVKTSTAGFTGSIPGGGNKIPHAKKTVEPWSEWGRELTVLILRERFLQGKGAASTKAPGAEAHWCVWATAWASRGWVVATESEVRVSKHCQMAVQLVKNGWILNLVNRLDVCYEKRINDSKGCCWAAERLELQLLRGWGVGKISSILNKLFEISANTHRITSICHTWEMERQGTPEPQERIMPRKRRKELPEPLWFPITARFPSVAYIVLLVLKSFHVFFPLKNINRSHPAQ